MKSKKQLFKDLEEIDPATFKGVGLDHRTISNETYGRQSCIYIRCHTVEMRRQIESALERRGHRIGRDYWPGSARIEVTVSYFKGWHWNE